MPETQELTYEAMRAAVEGDAAAFRLVAELQPAGGPGDKVFPSTYEGGRYAWEDRRINGQVVRCVLLDSVQSQANRMELALLDALRRGRISSLPLVEVDFASAGLPDVGCITSLDAPHRIADAILRDSLLDGKPFRKSADGRRFADASVANATLLLELCPTALLFGMWDSTGPKGGMGAKFARAVVSEIVGINAVIGAKTSSRIDPLQIPVNAGPLYQAASPDLGCHWTLDPGQAAVNGKGEPTRLGKDGRPSEAIHGNITPTIAEGGVTIDKAVLTMVLSLPALRRLRFPLDGQAQSDPAVDDAARTLLAALGLCAATLAFEHGFDLRSRCLLTPTQALEWELIAGPAQPRRFAIDRDAAIALYEASLGAARKAGLPWRDQPLRLTPSPQLVALVKRSQELAAASAGEEGGE